MTGVGSILITHANTGQLPMAVQRRRFLVSVGGSHMHVCQEHWHREGGICARYLLTIINGCLNLSSPKDKYLGAGSLLEKWFPEPQMTKRGRWDKGRIVNKCLLKYGLPLEHSSFEHAGKLCVVYLRILHWYVGSWAFTNHSHPLSTEGCLQWCQRKHTSKEQEQCRYLS